MKNVLLTIGFVLSIFIALTIASFLLYLSFSLIGISFSRYGWLAIVLTFIFLFWFYKSKDLNFLKNKLVWTSLAATMLIPFIIPNGSPLFHHTDLFIHGFGFPFKFITLYMSNGSNFLLPNLYSTHMSDWSLAGGSFLLNFIFFYLIVYILNVCLKSKELDTVS